MQPLAKDLVSFWDLVAEAYAVGSGAELVDKCALLSGTDTMETISHVQAFLMVHLPRCMQEFAAFTDEEKQLNENPELRLRREASQDLEPLNPQEPIKFVVEFAEDFAEFFETRTRVITGQCFASVLL